MPKNTLEVSWVMSQNFQKFLSNFCNFRQNLIKELKLKSQFPQGLFVAVIKQKYRGTLITKYDLKALRKETTLQLMNFLKESKLKEDFSYAKSS